MAEPVRAQKAIAHSGLMSRRLAEEAILAGRVEVDGRRIVLGDRVDVSTQQVTLDGIPIPVNPDLETHLLFKPLGVISTASDPQGRETVVDLVPTSKRVYPVGRLDSDSEGLILLTNDGDLANRVTHPRYGITKTYVVIVDGRPAPAAVRRLTEGVELDDGPRTGEIGPDHRAARRGDDDRNGDGGGQKPGDTSDVRRHRASGAEPGAHRHRRSV